MGKCPHLWPLRGRARLVTCPRLIRAEPGPASPVNAQETRFLRPRRSLFVPGLLVLVGAALLLFGVGVATPEPAAIQQKRAQVEAIQAELAAIDAEVERAAEAYNGARYQLGLIRARIEQNRRQTEATKRDLEKSEKVLGERLRDIYATPDPTLAEVVISSGSITAAADQIRAPRPGRAAGRERGQHARGDQGAPRQPAGRAAHRPEEGRGRRRADAAVQGEGRGFAGTARSRARERQGRARPDAPGRGGAPAPDRRRAGPHRPAAPGRRARWPPRPRAGAGAL